MHLHRGNQRDRDQIQMTYGSLKRYVTIAAEQALTGSIDVGGTNLAHFRLDF